MEAVDTGAARFDLLFNVWEVHGETGEPAGIEGDLVYATDLFDRSTAEAMAERLVRLLGSAVREPERRVGELEVMSAEERRRVLEEWNDTARRVPEGTLVDLFEEQVRRSPEGAAVECEGEVVSYGELNRRANRLARVLMERGVGPEVLVGLALPRSVEMVVGMLAVMKAGGAYVPLDPEYPAERIGFMVEDARPLLMLATTASAAGLPGTAPVVAVDDPVVRAAVAGCSAADPTDADREVGLRLDHPAYAIYTSGSTGRPKGVLVSHRGIASLSASQVHRYGVGQCSRVLQLASPSFDLSVAELCMALLSGACLVVAPAGLVLEDLAAFLAER